MMYGGADLLFKGSRKVRGRYVHVFGKLCDGVFFMKMQ